MAIDGEQLAQLTSELAASTYHVLLTEVIQFRIAQLLSDDARDPYAVMKLRGGIEELQRLLQPGMLHALALRGVERQQRFTAVVGRDEEPRPPRDWWADPTDLRE